MNKARGQKKDVTRILKAMKLEQSSTKYYETVNQDSLNTVQTKNYGQTIVYAASNKRSQNSRGTKRRNYRYEKNMGENQQNYSLGYRQQRSLQVRKDNYFKISQKFDETGAINPRNPYLDRKRLQSIKPMRRSSNQGRRNYTQQSSNNVPLAAQHKKRNFHFNTIQSSYNQMDPTNLIEQAKIMANNGSIVQSEMLIQKVLRENPENKQALYVSGCNNFKQMNYLRCITALNTLLQIDPSFNKNAFVMCSICYSNKGQKEEAMLRINTCLSYFPDFYDAHFQKAKLYLKIDDTPNAVKSLKKALRLAKDPYECCFKLGQCYQKQSMYDLALKLYQKLTKHPNYGKSQEQAACLLKKAQCQKKLKKFKQYCQTLQAYLKKDRNQIINIANIYYEIGYAYYKLQDYSNSMMNLEQVFIQKSKKQSTDALILLTIINIKKRDFYEAHHSLQRKIHLDVNNQELEYYEKFCEGVLCLMKRKFQTGLEKLLEIESQTSQVFKDEFEEQISAIFPMYLAYAYFCFGRTDKCIKIYSSILKQKKDQLIPHVKGIQFNLKLCEGIQECKHKKLGAAKACFEKSVQIYPHKSEGYIYLAVTLIQMFLKDYNQSIIKKARAVLISCVKNLKQLNNNYAASILYVKAALQAFLGNWTDALDDITDSIQRAQDNDAKSFYLKALILACCQNYKQAISDASIAISLDAKQPSYYLLRSKCQQIQGDGNRAFMDLQQYIALSPEDSQIHKFAGHLLFQNGAFEDALQAYDNGQISVDISNYDVFLTRSKTYFLLGEFSKCVSDMQTAHKLKSSDPNISFDICILKILEEFFSQHKSNNLFAQKAEKAKQELQNLAAVGEDIDYGKIFKKIQISMLVSVFLFYMGRYKQSARQFKQTLTMKQANFTNNQSEFEQQLKQKQFFVSQMHHNRAICFLMISEYQAALKALQGCNIQSETKTYSRLAQLMDCIKNKKGNLQPIQIFSQKNKMSRMLNEVSIKLSQKQVIKIKLSIPFPKVEPPEINPKFELQILRQIDVEKIQKKPEAPWILRQLQSICFTEKIEKFSRLEMNNSEMSKVDKQKPNMRTQQQENENQIENSQYENSFESMEQLREKLKLDGKIEDKLNKILGKRKQADIMKDIQKEQ